MAAKQIILDGKVLEGTDMYGEWGVHTFEGWWDSPDAKTQETERPMADGDFNAPVYYKARYPTLTGIFIAESEAKMFDGMNRFSGLLRQPGRLQVVGYGPTQWATVQRASGLVITPQTDTVCLWQARIKAPDSRKFGVSWSFPLVNGAYVDLNHRGNYNASATVSVTGNAPGGYTLREPGGVYYEVTGSLSPGETHTIDFRTGIFRINGYIVAGETGVSDIWYIEPGVNKPMKITSSGTVNATATVVDTYI